MKQLIYLGFLLTLTGACTQTSVPAEYLTPDELSVLVEEVSVLEAHYQSTYGVPGQYKKALEQAVERSLQKHNCSLLKFKQSVFYYAAHPDLQSELNEKVMTQLSRKL
ncbi:MAG: hypothetical protein RLZZ65_1871 [Bacteroidota bacterium]|jgi:hypothetical protein